MNHTPELIKGLNEPQKEAVLHTEGPLLILAGAGSGKTRVLTHRMAYLIATQKCEAHEIFAVTFTNKAARSMQERAMKILMNMNLPMRGSPWISTFHSSGARILRDHIELLDYQKNFAIYDDSEQLTLVKKVANSLGYNDKVYPPRMFQSRINEAKNLAMSPQQMAQRSLNFMDEKVLKVFEAYEREMKKSNTLDFGDLLFKTYQIWTTFPEVLEYFQNKFPYIMVDEYQDTNHIQYKLINLLASKFKNICVVGDEDQSIYSWRGADISNILNFEKDYPEAKVIKLEQNYRSTQTIVLAASELIQNNTQRKNKKLFSEQEVGDKILIREEYNEHKEAQFVAREIQRLIQEENALPNEIAVFYRTNSQSRVLEDQFRLQSLDFKIIGAVNFYDRAEVKDLISYIKILVNPKDDLAVQRVINRPARRIGKTTVEKLIQLTFDRHVTLLEAIQIALEEKLFNNNTLKALNGFLDLIYHLEANVKNLSLAEAYDLILEKTGYMESLRAEDNIEAEARIENLGELRSAIVQFEQEREEEATLQNFLEEMSLVTDLDRQNEAESFVTLMTLHLSKGLEFPYVFIVGLEEGLFPSRQSFDSLDPTSYEEERRLAYVGMTRAQRKLYLLHARQRFVRGYEEHFPPSTFLREIPEKYVEKHSAIAMPRFLQNFKRENQKQDWRDQEFGDHPNYEDFESQDDNQQFQKGMRVKHPIFGFGVIHQTEGHGDGQRVTVLFNNNTLKKFAAKFARLEPV